MDKVRSVHGPDPLVLRGLVLLAVIKLQKAKKTVIHTSIYLSILAYSKARTARDTHIANVLVGLLGGADFVGIGSHVDLSLAPLIHLPVLQLQETGTRVKRSKTQNSS